MVAGRRDPGLRVVFLHSGLAFDGGEGFRPEARYVEVLPEPGVLLQPVLVVALKPVDLSVFEAEKGYGAVHFCIVFHIVYAVILGQCALQHVVEGVVGSIPDPEHVDSVFMQLDAEIAVVYRKVGRHENKVSHFHWGTWSFLV